AFSSNGSLHYTSLFAISDNVKKLGDDILQIFENMFPTRETPENRPMVATSSQESQNPGTTGFSSTISQPGADSPLRDALQSIMNAIRLLGEGIASVVSNHLPSRQ